MKEFSNWREYQEETAAFFERQGCSVQVEAKVQGVRAQHEVDVYVKFFRHGIECKWVIECKLWKSKIPKEKVMALKSIIDDILIWSSTIATVLVYFECVCSVLQKYRVSFRQENVTFLWIGWNM